MFFFWQRRIDDSVHKSCEQASHYLLSIRIILFSQFPFLRLPSYRIQAYQLVETKKYCWDTKCIFHVSTTLDVSLFFRLNMNNFLPGLNIIFLSSYTFIIHVYVAGILNLRTRIMGKVIFLVSQSKF